MLDRKKKIARALKSRHKSDIGEQIVAQMKELLGNDFAIHLDRERPWASITFTGIRYQITVRRAADITANGSINRSNEWANILAQLPEHEFSLRGCFVADLTMTCKEKGQHALIEVLTIFDPVKPQ